MLSYYRAFKNKNKCNGKGFASFLLLLAYIGFYPELVIRAQTLTIAGCIAVIYALITGFAEHDAKRLKKWFWNSLRKGKFLILVILLFAGTIFYSHYNTPKNPIIKK